MCLKCLPYLLEDESQRTTAQLAGLTDSVLRAMVLFPDSIELHSGLPHTRASCKADFCSSEAILKRACLVLHNLSLNEEYHSILLWMPNCYQMLEWCLGNYPHDHVLQQSAGGTGARHGGYGRQQKNLESLYRAMSQNNAMAAQNPIPGSYQ